MADHKKVMTDANVRSGDVDSEVRIGDTTGKIGKLGSRVTTKQAEVVLLKATPTLRKQLVEGDDALDKLQAYADTGDKAFVTSEQYEVLQKIVSACKAHVEGDDKNGSKARRFWPRKTAAIIVAVTRPIEEPVEQDEESESTEAAA